VPYAKYPANATLAQSLRPYPQFGNITVMGAPLGNTWFDSLQTKLTKRVSHGLDLFGTFVWEKELTNTEGYVNNFANRSLQKTFSNQSQPLALVVAFNYRTPSWGPNRWMHAAVRDWTISGILKYASGLPIPAPVAQNNLNSLLFVAGGPSNPATYANRVPGQPLFLKDLNCHCIDPNKDFVLNPAAWSQPAAGQYGVGNPFYNDYRYERTPSEQMSLGRIFRLRENMNFQIRAEFFNVFNRIYLNQPVATNALQTPSHDKTGRATGGFGYIAPGGTIITTTSITQGNGPRTGQLVVRLQF